jgi:2-polyprenyl-6-methoxyphenol hydroxylase-like FAD-dependent oxidoreductase
MKQVPVLIAGGGPVGMTLARELACREVTCMLVERHRSAHVTDPQIITEQHQLNVLATAPRRIR